jgi:long-chain acyl-CoA synthetase
MDVTRTFDLLERYSQNYPNKVEAISAKQQGKWISYSTKTYIDMCYNFAYGLLEFGMKKGDKIVTATNNRPEWNFVDHGMAMCGIVHVPVYTSLNEKEYQYILDHSEANMVFVADKKLYDIILPACKDTGLDKNIYCFDSINGLPFWKEIVELGRENADKWKDELEKIKNSIQPGDFTSLLYTSGTTGQSKGVMLSHNNMVQNFINAAGVFQLNSDEKYLSILPLSHVGGRLGNYQTQYSGTGVYYAENMGAFAKAMKEISAHGFDAVPRVMEKVYDNVISKGNQLTGFKHKMFFWAVKLGLRYKPFGQNGWFYERKLQIADKLIFSKWREALGGNVKLVGCGGAALQPRLERVFWAAGVKIINMYGLTETSPIVTINRQQAPDCKLGTVGSLIEGVEIKIAEDGEILIRGHCVMLGYYKDEKLTKETIDEDGWFHSGDIGRLEEGKFLAITDRKKEIFKLSNGKFVAPQLLENAFKESLYIDQIMVLGESEKFAGALVAPDFEQLKKWADEKNIAFSTNDELICLPEIQNLFKDEINDMNKAFSEHEKVLRFRIVKESWSPESGDLSPTLKLKRKVVSDRNKVLIDSMYGN